MTELKWRSCASENPELGEVVLVTNNFVNFYYAELRIGENSRILFYSGDSVVWPTSWMRGFPKKPDWA